MIPSSEAIAAALAFLAAHKDVVSAIVDAVNQGVTSQTLVKLIRASMVEASDELMKREMGVK